MSRPTYDVPANTSPAMAAMLVAATKKKAVYVNPDGVAFWLNDLARANAIAAKNGGVVYPPEATSV